MHTRLLWINLDPSWQLARMVQDHCLDLAVRDDCRIWDLAPPGSASAARSRAPWSDWPRTVAAEHLIADVDELLSQRAGGLPLLVALHLPAALAEDGDSGGHVGADPEPHAPPTLARAIIKRLDQHTDSRVLITLPAAAPMEPIAAQVPGPVRLRRLTLDPRRDPHGAIVALRLLLELHLQPSQAGADSARVADCRLEPAQRRRIQDRFGSQWRGLLPRLRAEVASLGRALVARPTGADPRALLEQALDQVAQLRDRPGGPALEPPAAAIQPLRPALPLFFQRRLADRLDALRVGLLERLDNHLSERFAALEHDHLGRQQAATAADERLRHSLQALTAAAVGFGSDGQDWLDYRRDQLRAARDATLQQGQALIVDMERDLRSRAHRRCGQYERHRFDEDDGFDTAVTEAKTAADGLMRLRALILAWLIGTAVLLVPILSARLPGWIDAGLGPYLASPERWLADLGWLLLPGAVLAGLALFFALRRRRRLAVAMARVQQQARRLWHRHAEVLGQTFALTGLGLAMRRLDLIQDHLLRLEHGLRQGRADLDALDRLFRQQQQDYAQLYPADTPTAQPAPAAPGLIDALVHGDSGEAWIGNLVAGLPPTAPETIEIEDWWLNRRFPFATRAIQGCALLALERPRG